MVAPGRRLPGATHLRWQTSDVRVILLTGPPGAGKTTVFESLMGLLEADGCRFAAVELEALALVHPWPDDDAAFRHLEFVTGSFLERGYPLLIVSATIEDADYLRRLLDALPSDDVFLVRLEAPAELLRDRLIKREPADWVGLPRLLDAAGRLAQSSGDLPGVDLVLSTEDSNPTVLAAQLRDAATV